MSREIVRGLRHFVTMHHFKFYFHQNVETVTLFQMVYCIWTTFAYIILEVRTRDLKLTIYTLY